MTREEYLEQAKARALRCLDAGAKPYEALTSIMADLAKHPDLEKHPGLEMCLGLMVIGSLNSPSEARHFIEGFN